MDNDKSEVSPYLVSDEPKYSNKMPQFYMGIVIVGTIVILFIIYYFYNSSSSFINPGHRSDPQMDDSYLETQIEFLNKMQDRNLSKM